MDGVVILSAEQVVSAWAFNWWAFVIAFVLITLFSLLMVYIHDLLDEIWLYVVFGVVSTIGGALFGFICSTPVEYETQYKVTIIDDVSMTEFYERYEVVEQEELIFTVREKTDEGNRSN